MLDISWLTDESAVKVTAEENGYLYRAEKLNTDEKLVISFDPNGSMLFNGEFVYTEDYMAIIGMLDTVNDTEHGVAVFMGEAELYT